eukprot:1161076-Pelagomonas_calceolata.AAC.6
MELSGSKEPPKKVQQEQRGLGLISRHVASICAFTDEMAARRETSSAVACRAHLGPEIKKFDSACMMLKQLCLHSRLPKRCPPTT